MSGLGDDIVLGDNPDERNTFWVFYGAGECGWGPDYPCYKIRNYYRNCTEQGCWLNMPEKKQFGRANLVKTSDIEGEDVVWSPRLVTDGKQHVAFRLSKRASNYVDKYNLLSAWAKGDSSYADMNCWTSDVGQFWRVELAQPKPPTGPVRIKTENADSRIDKTRPYLKGNGPGQGPTTQDNTLTGNLLDPTTWWVFHETGSPCDWGPASCYYIQNYAWANFWNKDYVVAVPSPGDHWPYTRTRMQVASTDAKNIVWSPTAVDGPRFDLVAFRLMGFFPATFTDNYLLNGWADSDGAYADINTWQILGGARWFLEEVNEEDLDPYWFWYSENAYFPPTDQVVRLKTADQKFVLRGNPGQKCNLASYSTDERNNHMSMWRFRQAEDCGTNGTCYWIENYGMSTKQPPQAYKLSFDPSTLSPGTVRTANMQLTPLSNGKWIPFVTCSRTDCSQQQNGSGLKISLAPRSEGYTDKYQNLVPDTKETSVSLKNNKDNLNGNDWFVEVVPKEEYDPYGWEYDQVNQGQDPWVPPLDGTPVYISNNDTKLLHNAGFCRQAANGCKYSTGSWWMFQNWTKCLDIFSNVKDLGTTAPAYCIVNYFQKEKALGSGPGSAGEYLSWLTVPPNFTNNSLNFAWVAIPAGQEKCSPGKKCEVKLGLVPSSNHSSSGKAWVSVYAGGAGVELASFSGDLQTWKVTPVPETLPKVDCSNPKATSCGGKPGDTCDGTLEDQCCDGVYTCPSYPKYKSSCSRPKTHRCET